MSGDDSAARNEVQDLATHVEHVRSWLSDLVERERLRNDLQSTRIKALANALDKANARLVAAGILTAADGAADLEELHTAMKPVPLTPVTTDQDEQESEERELED